MGFYSNQMGNHPKEIAFEQSDLIVFNFKRITLSTALRKEQGRGRR